MALTIYRMERDGSKQVVSCVDDWAEVGPIIYDDRKLFDEEISYFVENDGEEKSANLVK